MCSKKFATVSETTKVVLNQTAVVTRNAPFVIDMARLDVNGHLNMNWNFWQVYWRDYKLNFHPAPMGIFAPCLPTIDGVTPPPIDIGAHVC